MGSRHRLDRQLVEAEQLPFTGIFAGKLRRYFSWHYFLDPFLILVGFFQSLWIMATFRPQVVFSKGGYVSFPVSLAAFIMGRPVILHESDASLGLANRLIARFAKTVCVSFPHLVKPPKYIFTGNPVRLWLREGEKKKGYELTGFDAHLPTVLVWGGSQGALQINQLVEKEFKELTRHFYVIHITGQGNLPPFSHPHYRGFEYVDQELKDLYAITHLVLGRAGANSLFELALLQKPNLVMPLKNADQQANAQFFVEQGASVQFKENSPLVRQIQDLLQASSKINAMKKALEQLAPVEAAQKIATVIEKNLNPKLSG